MKRVIWALLLSLPALPATAQEGRPLTGDVAAAIAAFYNDAGTIRLSGETRVPAGTELTGDVASLGGPMVVAGTVRGDVVVINGDLRLEPGGRVTGGVTLTGGALRGDSTGIGGPIVVYPEAMRVRWEGDRLIGRGPGRDSWLSAAWPTRFGRAELTLAVDGSYNRVEGLPVRFGPRIELGQSNPTVVDARLIYRTRSGLRVHPDELGHDVRVEQYLGGHRSVRVGLGRHRVVDPIEDNGLTDTENSLSTFLLHRDYRDHYARRGWRAYLLYGGQTRPLDFGIEYRDETHGTAEARTPWSLLDNDEPWRPQPLVAEGDIRLLRGWLVWDTRNERLDPATGWLVELELEQGLEGELEIATVEEIPLPGEPFTLTTRDVGAEFTTVRFDVRRYVRMGPRTRMAFRAAVAGSPDDGALPPQRQHILGGEGTMPGYDRFFFDCGARGGVAYGPFLPYYGCDRSVLFQVEGRLALTGASGFSVGRLLDLDFELLTTPELVLFADIGRAWIEAESIQDRRALGPRRFRSDIGAGLKLGRLGFYLATGLSDGGQTNFFVRLGPRL